MAGPVTIYAADGVTPLFTSGNPGFVTTTPAAGSIQQMEGAFTELPGLTAGSLNADLIPAQDISAYTGVSLHIGPSAYSGTLVWRGSNDLVNWYQFNALDINSSSNYINSTSSNNQIIWIPKLFRYLRVRMESYSSGAAQAVAELYTFQPFWEAQRQVSQQGTWTVQPGNTQNTTPWLTTTFALGQAVNGALFAYSPGATFAGTLQTTSGYPFSVFCPASGGPANGILLLSATADGNGAGTTYHISRTNADPAYGSAGNISNQKGGGAASKASVTYATSASAWPAVYEQWVQVGQNTPVELIAPGGIFLPAGQGATFWVIPAGAVTEFIRVIGIEF